MSPLAPDHFVVRGLDNTHRGRKTEGAP